MFVMDCSIQQLLSLAVKIIINIFFFFMRLVSREVTVKQITSMR